MPELVCELIITLDHKPALSRPLKGCQTRVSTLSRRRFWMGASCFWNIGPQGRRRTAISRRLPGLRSLKCKVQP
jgi:hypothetical protein